MKMPNFRLYDTQATFGMLASFAGLACICLLAVAVLKNLDTSNWVIPYNTEVAPSKFRKPFVFAMTPVAVVLGASGGILGFRSLGQARNTKQGRSWLGMTLGALTIALAPVLFATWSQLSEPMIVDRSDSGKSVTMAQ